MAVNQHSQRDFIFISLYNDEAPHGGKIAPATSVHVCSPVGSLFCFFFAEQMATAQHFVGTRAVKNAEKAAHTLSFISYAWTAVPRSCVPLCNLSHSSVVVWLHIFQSDRFNK